MPTPPHVPVGLYNGEVIACVPLSVFASSPSPCVPAWPPSPSPAAACPGLSSSERRPAGRPVPASGRSTHRPGWCF
ncbi:hypothetical protein FKM82_030575 [Ascaphus truei]